MAGNQTSIQKLSKAYPSLKHWSLGRFNGKVVADIYDQGKITMPTIQSVAMTCQGCCLEHSIYFDDIHKLLSAFPNLQVIHVGSLDFKTDYHISNLLQAVVAACPKLAVLNISSQEGFVPEYYVMPVIQGLKNLEVLALPYDDIKVYSNSLVNAITENLPKVRSVLAQFIYSRLSKKPSLKYLLDPATVNIAVKNPNSNTWRSVQINSNEWYEAHGMNYFYPESTYKYLQFTENVKNTVSERSVRP